MRPRRHTTAMASGPPVADSTFECARSREHAKQKDHKASLCLQTGGNLGTQPSITGFVMTTHVLKRFKIAVFVQNNFENQLQRTSVANKPRYRPRQIRSKTTARIGPKFCINVHLERLSSLFEELLM